MTAHSETTERTPVFKGDFVEKYLNGGEDDRNTLGPYHFFDVEEMQNYFNHILTAAGELTQFDPQFADDSWDFPRGLLEAVQKEIAFCETNGHEVAEWMRDFAKKLANILTGDNQEAPPHR